MTNAGRRLSRLEKNATMNMNANTFKSINTVKQQQKLSILGYLCQEVAVIVLSKFKLVFAGFL